jgi:hypothetical protein
VKLSRCRGVIPNAIAIFLGIAVESDLYAEEMKSMSIEGNKDQIQKSVNELWNAVERGDEDLYVLNYGLGGYLPVNCSNKPHTKAPPSATLEQSDEQKSEGAAREPAAPKSARSVETPTTTAKLRLHIAVPAELAARANRAAEKARCPARKVALAALNEIKPSLLERLNSIRYGQIEPERQENVGFSISTTWQIPAKTETHLKSELDPVGIGQVNRLVSHWIRGQFLDHFEKYLKKLGH